MFGRAVYQGQNESIEVKSDLPFAPPGATMAISFQSDEEVLRSLREKLRKMSGEELVRFGKEVRRLAENPFQRQLEEAGVEAEEITIKAEACLNVGNNFSFLAANWKEPGMRGPLFWACMKRFS